MPLDQLDHYTIRTTKLEETKKFFVDVLGFVDGDRPPFDFPGNWLYLGDRPLVHLVGVDANDTSGLVGYLGDIDLDDLKGSGAVDHLAFRCSDIDDIKHRLTSHGVSYRERTVPVLDLFQIFIEEPNEITVELNFYDYD
jgi:catechol 2,3-dioxygenase-like lactoylglutathione lyase family enzyme